MGPEGEPVTKTNWSTDRRPQDELQLQLTTVASLLVLPMVDRAYKAISWGSIWEASIACGDKPSSLFVLLGWS
jgi:hypothetical protein